MAEQIALAADLVWSYPVVGLCLLSALYFTLRLGLIQLRAFPHAIALILGRYDRPGETGNITHFQALAAALSGTIGIGNIAGVAIAIAVGGPGAVLWMWVTGLLGMATKFVECTLGTHYRKVDPATGEARGGPMYYIVAGLGPRWRPVAVFYALTIAFAGFGFTCMFQSNQAADALHTNFDIPGWITGAALMVLTGAVIIGGIQSIGRWAARLVPTMCAIYVGGALIICLWQLPLLPGALSLIVQDGLTGDAAAGGVLGSMILWGVRRAIFSNEAGLGSASIAHAAVKTDEPIREGVVASLGPFIDTVIVSGATALVIVLAGNYGALQQQGVGELAPISLGETWTEIGEGAPPELVDSRYVDGAAIYAFGGSPPSEGGKRDQIVYELDAAALDSDGVRVAARVLGPGSVSASLYADGSAIEHIELQAAGALGLTNELGRSGTGWVAATLEIPPDLRERSTAPELRLVVEPHVEDTQTWVAAPSVVEKRTGISLSSASFDRFIPGFGSIFITIAGFAFALSTMITWSYYGEVASTWLFGERASTPYRVVFVLLAFVGAVRKLDVVISVSDLLVGLLVIPNVIALLWLSPRVAGWSRDYFKRLRAGEFDEP